MEEQHLLQPLLSTTTTATTDHAASATSFISDNGKAFLSDLGIIFRLVLIILIGMVSIWANHEASKGFAITIINETADTSPGRCFSLFYETNDKATRILLNASKFVENILYLDDSLPKKQVDHVIFRLASRNLTHMVTVDYGQDNEFVLHVNPSIMQETNFSHAMLLAVQRGMARIWLWDGQGNAPLYLINGMVEYITELAGFGTALNSGVGDSLESDYTCWNSKDSKAVAQFLNNCERHRPGFIGRLNQAMRQGWHDRTVDDVLAKGHPLKNWHVSHPLLGIDLLLDKLSRRVFFTGCYQYSHPSSNSIIILKISLVAIAVVVVAVAANSHPLFVNLVLTFSTSLALSYLNP
ncbi:unnamed protein product [Ilex paraguariensis]|uniref:Uncharacterized protein n=1 Tax=Ilex paraguariensis TaxID=185542 RepID=A0ABC8TWQ2_9AQUA